MSYSAAKFADSWCSRLEYLPSLVDLKEAFDNQHKLWLLRVEGCAQLQKLHIR